MSVKRKIWGVIALISALGMTGCGTGIKLNEKQNAEAAEYIAGVLLKHSSNYDASLIYEDVSVTPSLEPSLDPNTEGETEPTKVPQGTEGNESGLKPGQEQLAKVLEILGVQLSCTSVNVATEYKVNEDDVVGVYAESGKKLVILKMKVKNTTNSKKEINLINKVKYQLITQENNKYSAELSLLDGDLNFFSETVKGEKSKSALLVFKVPKKEKVDNVQLTILSEKATVTLPIK